MSSQYGGAEFIYHELTRAGISNGLIFEAGAFYPDNISNSSIFLDNGWRAKLVECDPIAAEAWRRKNLPNAEVYEIPIPLVSHGLIDAFDKVGLQTDLDVLFLDIDGGEYHLLKAFLASNTLRPKFIHVEYDNAFPLFVDYVPTKIVNGRQASAIAFLHMLQNAGYAHFGTFGHDLVFVDQAFVVSRNLKCPTHEDFVRQTLRGMYSVSNVIGFQKSDESRNGVAFLASKLDILLESLHPAASQYYSFLAYSMLQALSFTYVVRRNDKDFCQQVEFEINSFISKYAFLEIKSLSRSI